MAGRELLEAALEYASRGWPVFPVQPGGKVPLIRGGRGFHDATTDAEQIRAWWRKYPNANIGLRTGVTFDAIDVDPRNGGAVDKYRALYPNAYRVRTGSGGLHVYCKRSGGSCGKIEDGGAVDFKGDGGYVVAAPSMHESGKRYEVENAGVLAPAVDSRRIRSDGEPRNRKKTAQGIKAKATIRTRDALVAERIEPGSRFDALKVAAMHLASSGATTTEIRAELERTAKTRLAAPGADTPKKIEAVIRSARRKYPMTSNRKRLRNVLQFIETQVTWRGRGGATDNTILAAIIREGIRRDAVALPMPKRSVALWAQFGSPTTVGDSIRRLARDGWLQPLCPAGRAKISSSYNYATGKPAPGLEPTSVGAVYLVTVPKKLRQSVQFFGSLPATAGEQAKELDGVTSLFHDAARWAGGVGPNVYGKVFKALLRRSWCNATELAEHVRLRPATARAGLKRLQREGIAANQGQRWFLAVTPEQAFLILDTIAARVVTRNAGVPGCPGETQVIRVGALKQRHQVAETVRRERAAYQARAMKAAGKPYGIVPDLSQVRRWPRPFENDARERPRGRLLVMPTRKETPTEVETTKIAARFKRRRKAARR